MPWLKRKVFPEVINPKFLSKIGEVSPIIKVVADIMAEHGITNETLDLDGTTSEFLLGEAFKEVGIKTVDAKYSMVSARTVKTQDEIELLRMICANTEPVFASIRDAFRPGVRECDLIALGMKFYTSPALITLRIWSFAQVNIPTPLICPLPTSR